MTSPQTKSNRGRPASHSQKVLAQRILARRRLLHFTKYTYPQYKPGWVHEDVCMRLEKFSEAVRAGKSPRLMLLMPPRHGKSELASIRFPAWHLGHEPTHEIINAGYNMDLPMIFSRKVRDILRDQRYRHLFPGTVLSPDSQSVEKWVTTAAGGFTAAGRGGGITGKGAHILIIDDPIKDKQEADSVLIRDGLTDWYQSTAYTRLAPGGGVLVIQTWWHDDDLAGRLINMAKADPEADQFEIVKYPALSEAFEYRLWPSTEIVRTPDEETDPKLIAQYSSNPGQEIERVDFLRPKDMCLHEERYPTEALKRIRSNLDPRIWSALYQQNPVPDEGMYFAKPYFKFVPTSPQLDYCRIITAWDFAIGEKQQNDWTVGATIAQFPDDTIHVMEIHRMKGDTFAIVNAIMEVARHWSAVNAATCDYMVAFEDGQIFKSLKPVIERQMQDTRQYFSYEVMKPFTDKMVRARPLQSRMQQGKVYWPERAPWTSQAVQEMLRFPAGVHDDVVDALSWAVRLSTSTQPPSPKPEVKLPSWKDKLTLYDGSGTSFMSA